MNYEIKGGNMPVVIVTLEKGEKMITESGAMSWMSPNMQMETKGGSVSKVLGRMFSGESLFLNEYTAMGNGMIAFASSFPGNIMALEITPENPVICQKSAFLAATEGVNLDVHFNKRASVGFFGGEGFIMQKLSGRGIAFVEIDGSAIEYNLQAGQKMIVDTGCLALCDSTVNIEVQTIKGAKNVLFGGEGFFNTVLTGPGKIVLQTMPIANVASQVARFIPTSGD